MALSPNRILKIASIVTFGCVVLTTFAAEEKPATLDAAGATNFYEFVNATRKFSDAQISWSFGERGPYTTFAQAKNAPPKMGGGGRMYFKIEAPVADGKPQTYKDFIEFTHNRTGWY